MVRIIKLMIRKSRTTGKKYYRYTIPIANEIFEKAGFKENDEFELTASKGVVRVKAK